MTAGEDWRVIVRNDDVNTHTAVIYALHRLAGLSVADASYQAMFIHERGTAEVGRFTDHTDAEMLAARLQVFGLHAQVRAE